MIDQEFAQWYVNEDISGILDVLKSKLEAIRDAMAHDLSTSYRPYATRVLLLKEDIIPKPPVIEPGPVSITELSVQDFYPSMIDTLSRQAGMFDDIYKNYHAEVDPHVAMARIMQEKHGLL